MRRLNIAALFALSALAIGCGSAKQDNPPASDPTKEQRPIDETPSGQDLGDAVLSARVMTIGDKSLAQSKEKKIKGGDYPAGNYKIDGGCALINELALAMTPGKNEKQDLSFAASTESMGELRHLNKDEKKKAITLALRVQKYALAVKQNCDKSKGAWGGKPHSDALVKAMGEYNAFLVERKVAPKKEAKKEAPKAKPAKRAPAPKPAPVEAVDQSLIEIEAPAPSTAPAVQTLDLNPAPAAGPTSYEAIEGDQIFFE